MAASKAQMNWSAVGFTPTGGSLIPFGRVLEVQVDQGGSLKELSGDADKYPTLMVNDMNNPKVTVRGNDVATLQGLGVGTVGTLTATHNDAKLASGGAIVYTMSNAVVENAPGGGSHAEYGEATVSFKLFSNDGVTSPIAITRV